MLIFLDNFAFVVIFCCIFTVFASQPIKGNDTRTNYSGMVRTKTKPQFPDPRYFDWGLCKVLEILSVYSFLKKYDIDLID